MSYKKFEQNDVIVNTMRTHPRNEFFIYDGRVYYNNKPEQSGAFSSQVLNVPPGHISLYEYNIDRNATTNPLIYPFVYKNSDKVSFKTISKRDYILDYSVGDQITYSYPLSASITRELMLEAGKRGVGTDGSETFEAEPKYRRFFALKNRLDFYGTVSEHFKVSSSFGNNNTQNINLISIPSIFYGYKVKPGTVSLKWYYTGSLIGELRDEKRNGELIQTGPAGSTGSGSVAGVIMYNEGFVLLTGSWGLSTEAIRLISGSSTDVSASWLYFGAGALDDVSTNTAGDSYASASFNLSFDGTSDVQVLTMFAHAKKGEVNNSNNPTFLQYDQELIRQTSSYVYEERANRKFYNTVSSSFNGFDAPYERQVYISRVAIYDESKNLLGIATLSDPVLKKEDEDLSFKIKLDI